MNSIQENQDMKMHAKIHSILSSLFTLVDLKISMIGKNQIKAKRNSNI